MISSARVAAAKADAPNRNPRLDTMIIHRSAQQMMPITIPEMANAKNNAVRKSLNGCPLLPPYPRLREIMIGAF
jgi:hypothetical protein